MLTAQSDCKICGSESASHAKAGSPKTTWSIACRLGKLKKRFVQNPRRRARFAERAEASRTAWRSVPSSSLLSLRHEHGEAFAGATGFDEFGHRQRVTAVAALLQFRHELGRAFGQNDVAVDHHGVTRKVHRFFRCDIDQISHVLPDCALPVFIECIWKPKPTAVRQRTKAGIKVVKTRINQLNRNSKTTEHFRDSAVRLNVGTKFVTAKKNVVAKERVAFAFEVKFLRQPIHFVAVLLHPFGEKRLLSSAFFVAEVAGDESAANR